MNKRKQNISVLALILTLCGPLHIQYVAGQTYLNKSIKGTTDPIYIQMYGGINKSANENLSWTEFSKYPLSGGAFIAVGKEFTPLWGWRIAVRYNHNKSRNVEKCENKATWGWNNVGIFADATFDITDAIRRATTNNKRHVFNLKAFAGIGAAYSFGYDDVPLSYYVPYSRKNRVVSACRIGFDATFNIAYNWRLGAELSQTIFTDRFNGVKTDCPFDTRTNLKVGVTYLFGKKNHKHVAKEPLVYANRLHDIPTLPFVTPKREDVKRRTLTGRAFLDFPVNETTIYPNYRRNPQELNRIISTIDSALFDHTMQVTSISLHGYASPESSYNNNTRLAKGRTAALKDYLSQHYNISTNIFHTTFTPEDWQNLREFIADGNRRRTKGDIWYENASILETPAAPAEITEYRDELLAIIDKNIDPDEKEAQLKLVNSGKSYSWLLKHVYPGLRHTDYVIEYVVRHYPVEESRRLIYTHPEALSIKEMYAVADSYGEGTDGWFDALTIAAKQYPNDPTANLNAACASVKAKRLSDAKKFLNKAGDSKEARYLANIIKAMEGKVAWRMENEKVIIDDNK